jgi:tetratricopeptide (TPR) repeat protein
MNELEQVEYQADASYQAGNYGEALRLYGVALELALAPYGREMQDHFRRGDWESAMRLFQDSVDVSDEAVGWEIRHVGQIVNTIGSLRYYLGDLDGANAMYKLAMMLHTELLDPNHPDAAIAYFNMGTLLQRQGNDGLAWECMAESLEFWRAFIVDDATAGYTHYLASSLYALGEMMANAGDFAGARQNFAEALALRESTLPPDHMDVVEGLAALGIVSGILGEFEDARACFNRALPAFVGAYGEGHPIVQRLYDALRRVEGGTPLDRWEPPR